MVDSFEELNLNPDLLRGIYGNHSFIQLLVFKSLPSFNKRVLSQLSARKTPSLKHNPEQVKLQLFPSGSSSLLILNLQSVKQLFLPQLDNLPNKLIKLFSVSVNLSKSIQDVVLVVLIQEKIEKLWKMVVFMLLLEHQEE